MRSKELNSFFVEELMAVSFIKSNEDDSGGGGQPHLKVQEMGVG